MGSAAVRGHLPALERLAGAEVVGASDLEPSRLEEVRDRLDGAPTFGGLDVMLAAVEPELLVIATPPDAHLPALAAAAGRGIDVLCEKPLGLGVEEVAALEGVRRRHPRVLLATVLQYRHAPTWRLVGTAVAGARQRGEPFRVTVVVERRGTDPLSAGGWRTDARASGGILADHAVHHLGLLHELDPGVRVVDCERSGRGGEEEALVRLSLAGGAAEVRTSYRGARRRNLVSVEAPPGRSLLCWEDGTLRVPACEGAAGLRDVEALSDRSLVNSLYEDMYAELLDRVGDPGWRRRRSDETIGVARLLSSSLTLTRVP